MNSARLHEPVSARPGESAVAVKIATASCRVVTGPSETGTRCRYRNFNAPRRHASAAPVARPRPRHFRCPTKQTSSILQDAAIPRSPPTPPAMHKGRRTARCCNLSKARVRPPTRPERFRRCSRLGVRGADPPRSPAFIAAAHRLPDPISPESACVPPPRRIWRNRRR